MFIPIFCTFATNSKVMKLNMIKSILVEKDYSQTQLAKELGKSFSVFADGQRLSCNRSLLAPPRGLDGTSRNR